MKKKQDENLKSSNSTGTEPQIKKKSPAGKFFKWMGIGLAALIGLIAIAVVVAAINGVFSNKKISIDSLSWEKDIMHVTDDFYAQINFLPEEANQLDVNLNLKYPQQTANIVEFPATVKAGEPFLIKVKKDANGNNIGGEVVIEAKTTLVKAQTDLKILVDVAIPTNGLVIASDFDAANGNNFINAGAKEFNIYVFTNPSSAIAPSTDLTTELKKSYKKIKLVSDDASKLQVSNTGVEKSGFFCPNYKVNGHSPIVTPGNGQTCPECANGVKLERIKYLEFKAKALESSNKKIKLTASALRTYDMQEEYVDRENPKYIVDGVFNESAFTNDLSAYVEKYQDLIKADTRKYAAYIDNVFTSGADYIAKMTQTSTTTGKEYIRIPNTAVAYNATLFYLHITAESAFTIQEIDIDKIETSLAPGEAIKFNLHATTTQLTFGEFKNMFGLKLIPTNTVDFTSEDLDFRIREMKIMCIKNKAADSTSPYNFDDCGYVFDIVNPEDTANPIWKITCINPINSADTNKNVRLRLYVPKANGGYDENCKSIDFTIVVDEIGVQSLEFKPNNNIITNMVTNNQSIGTSVHSQVLDSSCYTLTGAGDQIPTYNTVKFFVYANSAKTVIDGTATNYFKLKLSDKTNNPNAYNMTFGEEVISAYEVSNLIGGKNYLEALNASGNDPVRLFAAVIKTNYNKVPVDANGVPQFLKDNATGEFTILNPDFGGYVIINKTQTVIEITTEYYLENMNIYTANNMNVVDGTADQKPIFKRRNVGDGGVDTIKLLAANYYKIFASGYLLNETGEFDTEAGIYANKNIDYKSNIKYAMDKAVANKYIKFQTSSQDKKEYIYITDEETYRYDKTTGLFEINFEALVDKNLTSDITSNFDFRAVSNNKLLENCFDSNKSLVNMKVNYANFDKFILTGEKIDGGTTKQVELTESDGKGNYTYTVTPEVPKTPGEGAVIEWHAKYDKANEQVPSEEQKFGFGLDYYLDIQNADNEGYKNKIDSSCDYPAYVSEYVLNLLNAENSKVFGVNFKATFGDGSTVNNGINISNYLTVTHKVQVVKDAENKIIGYKIVPVIDFKMGTPEGILVKITCNIGLYQNNTGYIQNTSKTIFLKLVQEKVKYELYSPKNITYDGTSGKALAVNGVLEKNALVLNGGQNVNLLGIQDAGSAFGLKVYQGEGVDPNNYVPYMELDKDGNMVQATRNYLIIAKLDTDSELANFCTYTIQNSDVDDVPLYFKSSPTSDIRLTTTLPTYNPVGGADGKGAYELYLYADYSSVNKEAVISITSPFGGTSAKYNVYIKSSITLQAPSTNIITTTTTKDYDYDESEGRFGAKGLVDLSQHYKAFINQDGGKVEQTVSFEIDGTSTNASYGSIIQKEIKQIYIGKDVNGDDVYDDIYTIFQPENVYSLDGKLVKLKMYYYMKAGEISGKPYYSKHEVNQIDNKNLLINVKNGYEITINSANILNFESGQNINGDASNPSIDLFQYFFDELTNGKDFIKIMNLNAFSSAKDVTTVEGLRRLISLDFDTSNLSQNDMVLFSKLFASIEDRDDIKKGLLKTQSINSNLTLPIVVSFKEGIESGFKLIELANRLTLNLKAAIEFSVSEVNNIENSPYKKDITTDGYVIGHSFSSVNAPVDVADNPNQKIVNIANVNQTLYEKGVSGNILRLLDINNNDLLSSTYSSYKIYKFNENSKLYDIYDVVNDKYAKFNILTTLNSSNELTKLTLNIKNAVNTIERYKLSIITSISNASDNYDYYFTLEPKITLKTNYPLDNGKTDSINYETVKADSEIDLNLGFINSNERIQFLYENNIYKKSGAKIEQSLVSGNKILTINYSGELLTYNVLSGPAIVSNGKIKFDESQLTEGTSKEAVIRVVAFNGTFIDYKFMVYKTIPNVNISINKDDKIKTYAEHSYNLFDYISSTSLDSANFKLIIKYKGTYSGGINDVKAYEGTEINDNLIVDSNKILDYANKTLNIYFEDVIEAKTVTFEIYHNLSVNGNAPLILNFDLLPNIEISTNTSYKLVAGTVNNLMTRSGSGTNALYTINNADVSGINLEILSVNLTGTDTEAGYKTYNPALSEHAILGLELLKVKDSDGTTDLDGEYTLKTNNIGGKIFIKFKVTKSNPDFSHSTILKTEIVPNAKFNVYGNLPGISSYKVTAASAGTTVAVVLNDVEVASGVKLINPKTFNGSEFISDSNVEVKISAFPVDELGNSTNNYKSIKENAISIEGMSRITVSILPINVQETVTLCLRVTWTWKDNVDNAITYKAEYNDKIVLIVSPNITNDRVEYTGTTTANKLGVYSGTTVNINFDNYTTISQGKESVKVMAEQIGKIQTKPANVVFKSVVRGEDGGKEYYSLSKSGVLEFFNVKETTSGSTDVTLPIYYDLTGKLKGVYTQGEKVTVDGKEITINFNDRSMFYASTVKITIKVMPVFKSINFSDSIANDKLPNIEANAINLSDPYKNLYELDSEGNYIYVDNNGNVVTTGGTRKLKTTNPYPDPLSKLNVNEYNLSELFKFTPVSDVSFTGESEKISADLTKLYSSMINEIVVKGYSSAAKVETIGNMKQIQNAKVYVNFSVKEVGYIIPAVIENGVITTPAVWGTKTCLIAEFIPPYSGDDKFFRFSFDVKLPVSVAEGTITQKVIFDFTIDDHEGVINKAEFISSLDYVKNGLDLIYSETGAPTKFKLNADVSASSLHGLFSLGYLLKTETGSYTAGLEYNENSNIITYSTDNTKYFYYKFNNITLKDSYFSIEQSGEYASIENGYLVVEPYYVIKDKVLTENDFRKIKVTASIGGVINVAEFRLNPIIVEHKVEVVQDGSDYKINNYAVIAEVTNGNQSNNSQKGKIVNATSKDINLNTLSSDPELQSIFKNWVKQTSGETGSLKEYKITPNLNQITENSKIEIKAHLSLGKEAISSDFLTEIDYEFVPAVKIITKDLLIQPSTLVDNNEENYFIVSNTETNKIIESDLFEKITDPNANLNSILKLNDDYSNYIDLKLDRTTSTSAVAGNYNVTSDSILIVKPINITTDITLRFSFETSYLIDAKEVKHVKDFIITLQRNVGIMNLADIIVANTDSQGKATATQISEDKLNKVEIIGSGSFGYNITELNMEGGISATNYNDIVNISAIMDATETNVITSLKIDWTKLFDTTTYPNFIKLNSITFQVLYVESEVIDGVTVIKSTTIIKTVYLSIN